MLLVKLIRRLNAETNEVERENIKAMIVFWENKLKSKQGD